MKKIIIFLFFITSLFANSCENKLFSLSTQGNNGIKLIDIITDLSDTCNINVLIKDSLAQSQLEKDLKYLKLSNKTLKEFLDMLLKNNGFFYELDDNNLIISYVKTKTFKVDYINVSIESTNVSTENKTAEATTTTTTSTDFWDEFSKNIDNILNSEVDLYFKSPFPIINKMSGMVTITGTKKQLDRIEKYINELNKRLHKEVLIDLRIYSVKLSKSKQTGINWSQLGVYFNGGTSINSANILGSSTIFKSGTFQINGLLNFLSTYGQVNAISNPKLTTLNNQKALINVGQNVNYSYKIVTTDANGNLVQSDKIATQFVGIYLDIVPEISDNNVIIMNINPSISSLAPTQLNPNLPPDTYEKKLNTIVRVKNGDTIILGGLITTDDTFIVNGVPILKEIPLIKYLFSYKEKISNREELIFVITPHIINLDKQMSIKKAISLPSLEEF